MMRFHASISLAVLLLLCFVDGIFAFHVGYNAKSATSFVHKFRTSSFIRIMATEDDVEKAVEKVFDQIEDAVDAADTMIESVDPRTLLKKKLLQLGASFDRGFGASPKARQEVNKIIKELENLNKQTNAAEGIDGSSESPLSGSWRMIWTSAVDVLALEASPIATVGAIYQLFDPPVVTNVIDFIPRVQSILPPSGVTSSLLRVQVRTKASKRYESDNRVGLVFENVKLQPMELIGMDVSGLPPVSFDLPKIPGLELLYDPDSGPGYFDVSYLDDELLIIKQNDPGGIFALYKVEDSDP